MTVETAGQWAHDDQRQIAAALQLPEDQVRVIYRTIGGAFGGREDISVQIVLALAAWKLRSPVRMVWSGRNRCWRITNAIRCVSKPGWEPPATAH